MAVKPFGVIYALSLDGRDFRYVGMTKSPAQRRLYVHVRNAKGGMQYPVYQWMRKHGPENIVTTVLGWAYLDDLPSAEMWFIADLREQGYRLLNCNDGGLGSVNPSAETRARTSASMKALPWSEARAAHQAELAAMRRGSTHSDETKTKMSAAHKGRKHGPHSAETRAKMSESARRRDPSTRHVPTEEERLAASQRFTGVPLTEEHRAKLAAAKKGVPRSDAAKEAVRQGRLRYLELQKTSP